MSTYRIRFASAFAFAALNLVAAAEAAVSWALVDIGTLGGQGSYGSAVSAGGVVAGCADAADGSIHAFTWYGGEMRDLGSGCALAVNDRGTAAGRSTAGELVVWQDGAITSLGIKGDIGGMNASGVVVGTRAEGDSTRAFAYRGGTVTDLTGDAARSEATAINARGEIVGASNGHAFVHDGAALRDLGTLGGNNSVARGINVGGDIVGMSSNEFGAPAPFIVHGTMQPLPGPAYSAAIAISAGGLVVGSGEGIHGYLIDGGTVTRMAELPTVVAKGWRKLEPTGTNDRGWIVGTAENAQGELRAFLLLPVAPGKPYRPGLR